MPILIFSADEAPNANASEANATRAKEPKAKTTKAKTTKANARKTNELKGLALKAKAPKANDSKDLTAYVQGLPPELFDEIFRLTFTAQAVECAVTEAYRPSPLLRIDRRSRAMFAPSYYGNTAFNATLNLARLWLESLPETYKPYLKKVMVIMEEERSWDVSYICELLTSIRHMEALGVNVVVVDWGFRAQLWGRGVARGANLSRKQGSANVYCSAAMPEALEYNLLCGASLQFTHRPLRNILQDTT